MADFWRSSGFHLLRVEGGELVVGDDFLRAFLLRPELAPVEESCAAERTLHAALLDEPRQPVEEARVAALVDPDAADNWRAFLRFRARLLTHPGVAAAYLDLIRNGLDGVPPLFLDQLVHVLVRHLLDGTGDPFRARAGELLFREQRVTIQDGRIMLADEETVVMIGRDGGLGSLGRLLVEAEAPRPDVELDVLQPSNVDVYWDRSDRFDTVLDLGFTRPGLDALCRVLERWVLRFTGAAVSIQPVAEITDERWVWHVGLDAESSALLNDLYRGDEVDEARRARLLALFRLEFGDPADMMERVRGRPVHLGLAMTADQRLRLKPHNLILNLPLRTRT